RAERYRIFRDSRGVRVDRHIVAVNEIDVTIVQRWVKPAFAHLERVPTHVRYFQSPVRNKPFYGQVEYAQAWCVIFFRMRAKQLHAETNTEDRLAKFANYGVELLIFQVRHRAPGLTDTRKNYFVGSLDGFGIISDRVGNTQPFQCERNGLYVSGIVLNNREIHISLFIYPTTKLFTYYPAYYLLPIASCLLAPGD